MTLSRGVAHFPSFQFSLGGFCGAGERQKRDIQEVVGNAGQAAPERLPEEKDRDEEEGGGRAETATAVVQAGASWKCA